MASAGTRRSLKHPGFASISESDVVQFLPLVTSVFSRMAPLIPSTLHEDLFSWGVVGLLDSLLKYDVERGEATFSTYAQYRIRGAMLDYLRREDWVPRSVRMNISKVERAMGTFSESPSREELGKLLGISPLEIEKIQLAATQAVFYIDPQASRPSHPDAHSSGRMDERGLEEIHRSADDGPGDNVLKNERVYVLSEKIDSLPQKERIVVRLYYFDELTMREIADALGLTEGRVSQLHSQGLCRLRSLLADIGTTL